MPELPEITRERALDMILASIAMEEVSLSHIINAEARKLQHVLGALDACHGLDPDIDALLSLNKSITCLLDSVSQNQLLLKNKMDKVLQALTGGYPDLPYPIGPCKTKGAQSAACSQSKLEPSGHNQVKCNARFKCAQGYKPWQANSTLPWNSGHIQGPCIYKSSCNASKILLCSQGQFMVSFAVNVKAKSCHPCDIAINLQMSNEYHDSNLFTFRDKIPHSDTAVTVSMGGIIMDTLNQGSASSLCLKLVSSEALIVESAMLHITEI